MKMNRLITAIAASVMAGALLGGCGSDDPAPSPEITIGNGNGDGSSFTPEQQEVVDAVDGYFNALFGRDGASAESALDGKLTDKLAARLIPDERAAIDEAGLQYLGSAVVHPKTVKISGDVATFSGCLDASKVFIVKSGETAVGPGSQAVASSNVTIEVVRENNRWLISEPISEMVEKC